MAIVAGEPERDNVGIVGDVRNRGLDAEPVSTMYVPQAQLPDGFNSFFLASIPVAWVVHTAGDPTSLAGAIEAELRRVTNVPVIDIDTMANGVSTSTSREAPPRRRRRRAPLLVFAPIASAKTITVKTAEDGRLASERSGWRISCGIGPLSRDRSTRMR